MADDPFSRFANKFLGKTPPAPTPAPTLPPSLTQHPDSEGREVYEAFDNQVRTPNIEIRCFRTGLSYSVPYAHMSGILFEFRTGAKLSFDASGWGFTIQGKNLREILRALNLHTCGFIQDYDPQVFALPEPHDPKAAIVARIDVVALRPAPPAKANGGERVGVGPVIPK